MKEKMKSTKKATKKLKVSNAQVYQIGKDLIIDGEKVYFVLKKGKRFLSKENSFTNS
jgi:hypothetical protein